MPYKSSHDGCGPLSCWAAGRYSSPHLFSFFDHCIFVDLSGSDRRRNGTDFDQSHVVPVSRGLEPCGQRPQQRLYFLPLPQGQGALRPIAGKAAGAPCLLFGCADRRSIIFPQPDRILLPQNSDGCIDVLPRAHTIFHVLGSTSPDISLPR